MAENLETPPNFDQFQEESSNPEPSEPINHSIPPSESPPFKDSAKALELKEKGNLSFKSQDINQALECYEEAVDLCPESDHALLLVLFSNIAVCYSKHKDFESVVEFTTKALNLDCSHIKSLLNRAAAYEALNKPEEALDDYKKLLGTGHSDEAFVREKIWKLEKAVEQLNEKRKTEVLDGLKGLGNTILGKFGMSLDNFKLEKNENGSYNISMKK